MNQNLKDLENSQQIKALKIIEFINLSCIYLDR